MEPKYRKRGKYWQYRIRKNGKEISKSGFLTKKLAIESALLRLKELKNDKIDSTSTIYDLWLNWYELEVKPSNKSIRTKEKIFRAGNQIKVYFDKKIASKISYSEYQTLLNDYGKNVGADTLSRLNSMIRQSIILAQRDKINIDNFTIGVKINGQRKPKSSDQKYISSLKDYHRLIDYLKYNLNYSETIMHYVFYVQLKTGLRIGELLALTWNEIDFEKSEIYTWRRIDSARHILVPPKTKTSVRKIPISSETLEVLKKLKAEQQDRNIMQISDGFIFFDIRVGIPTNNGVNKALKRFLEKLEIRPLITSTGCRHTYCCVLILKGVDLHAIAKIMGHKNIQKIIDTYGHVLRELEEKEHDKIRLAID
jgi:integrase